MTVKQSLRGWVVRWRLFLLFIVLIPTIVNLGGCLKAFTQGTNQPPTAPYEAGGSPSRSDLPTPQLLDIRLNTSDDQRFKHVRTLIETIVRSAGTTRQVVADIHAYNMLEVSELIFDFRSATMSESLDRMEHFATVIKPAAGI